MATRKSDTSGSSRRRPPATTPEERERRLIAKSLDLAERQIDDGTVSAQVLSHFVRASSSRERLEQEKLEKENELLEAKREMMASAARIEELYAEAINAMRSYAGQQPLGELESADDYYED